MRSDTRAIAVDNVTKTFRIGVGRARVREMLPSPLDRAAASVFPRWWRKNTFNALEEVSLDVSKGSSVSIVGHNGAGKTTLLKVIAGVTGPTEGSVSTSGRTAALLDVVVGFHPELTGRENAFLLGAIYGVPRPQMTARMENILSFAEIGELANTPVKRFSTGMVARLGFATLTALDADILLIDEVLAVGDSAFQRKCVHWLEGFQDEGGTLLFVSHNLALIRNMTSRTIHLDHGRLVEDGPTADVLHRYALTMERRDGEGHAAARKRDARRALAARGLHRWGRGGVRVDTVHFAQTTPEGDRLDFDVRYSAAAEAEGRFFVSFLDEREQQVGVISSERISIAAGAGRLTCTAEPVALRPGIYFPIVGFLSADGTIHDRWQLDRAVVIEEDSAPEVPGEFGPVLLPGSWSGPSADAPRSRALPGGSM